MENHGRAVAGLSAGLTLLLAGCTNWSFQPPMRGNESFGPHTLARVREAAPQNPTTFNQALTADYAGFAGSLHDEIKDWADTDYFARKGLAASRGEVVPPENNGNWLIPLEVPNTFRTELAQSRERLRAALDGGGRDRLPLVAARAQVSYDCWVERMEDDWKTAIDGPCRKQFQDAMARLEGRAQPAAAPAPAREFRIYFDFDKSDLVPEAQQILQQLALLAQRQPELRLTLVGKADRAGSDGYNMNLSRHRAEIVRSALAAGGVAAGRMDTRWVGEREPPVPTPDSVREPRNRVVEIDLR